MEALHESHVANQEAAGSEYPCNFLEGPGGIGNMLQHCIHDGNIERPVLEWQRFGGSTDGVPPPIEWLYANPNPARPLHRFTQGAEPATDIDNALPSDDFRQNIGITVDPDLAFGQLIYQSEIPDTPPHGMEHTSKKALREIVQKGVFENPCG